MDEAVAIDPPSPPSEELAPNSSPVQLHELADQTGIEEETVRFMIPRDAFADPDGDPMRYAVSLASGEPIPTWLRFIPKSLAFFGDPLKNDAGVYQLVLTATDPADASVSMPFTLTILGSSISEEEEKGKCIIGGVGSDVLYGTAGQDCLQGQGGNDQLNGGDGDDFLDGGTGRDVLDGGAGNDTLQFAVDTLWPACTTLAQAVRGSACAPLGDRVNISGMNRSLDIFNGGAGFDILKGTSGNDVLRLQDGSAGDGVKGARIIGIEQIDMGAGNDVVDLTSLTLLYGDVTVDGGDGNDVIWSNAGNDILRGGAGHDRIDGGAGNDLVQGGTGNDTLCGGAGNDINQGQDGNDRITDTAGKNVLDGGAGTDYLQDGDGDSFLAGGKGNDQILTGRGRDVIAFNRGDGKDVLIGGRETAANDVLSLAGGIQIKDLSLVKSGYDLVLNFDGKGAESMTLKDWYAGNKTIATLQIVTRTATGLTHELYDFADVVVAFDKLKPRDLRNGPWSISSVLTQNQLNTNPDAMLGGELAAHYALHGGLTGMSLAGAQATLGSADFGLRAQIFGGQAGLAGKDGLMLG